MGVKVFGEGEWKVRKFGYDKRRTWRKVHIGMDADTGQIIGSCSLKIPNPLISKL